MKAVVFHRPYELAVEDVPEPKINDPNEVIVEVTINFKEQDPGETILDLTGGRGADIVIDVVGFEAEPTNFPINAVAGMSRMGIPPLPGLRPEDQPALASVSAINWEVEAIRHGGTLGLAGVYGAKANGFPIGDIFAKGVTIKCGQALVQNYLDELLKYIAEGRIRVDDIITHTFQLDDAMKGYQIFSRKEDDCVKVVMHPVH